MYGGLEKLFFEIPKSCFDNLVYLKKVYAIVKGRFRDFEGELLKYVRWAFYKHKSRGIQVSRSRTWDWKVQGSKLHSTEDLPCVWACCTLKYTKRVKRPDPLVWCGSLEGCASPCAILVL
ncbi:hypothetical protein AVEN_125119-1 [Araneus ventricosus]|uniref:Uncharacterized protein n=1 Tax=Araneus ventricosus TaxID=182803 RepID=A0A4Y2FU89_ARAVE|nr:hypothetical protein AVEN_125119-1 [Araneus ventricosus]